MTLLDSGLRTQRMGAHTLRKCDSFFKFSVNKRAISFYLINDSAVKKQRV